MIVIDSVARLLPRVSDYAGLRSGWKADLIAGITVGVVALPLALAFGITTGLGAAAGLVTAVVAGFVAALFGGSNVQVSGPTGAMTVVLVPIVLRDGPSSVVIVSIMAGIMIVLAALFRLGRYLEFIPWPVFEGFTVGIAIIIFLQQVPSALGVPKPDGERTVVIAFRALLDSFESGNTKAITLVLLVCGLMVGVRRIRPSLPNSLIAVLVSTIAAEALGLDVTRIGALPSSLPAPTMPSIAAGDLSLYASAALAVALLAAIESLLSAKVADGMADATPHDPDRELFGQGLANIVSPLFGGMPATGAIARTAVNVRTGARTRVASMVHAVVLLLVVYFGGDLVSRIPLAALAGVLMVTAFRMIERQNVIAVMRATRSDAIVVVLTALCTVAFDLIKAVQFGIIAAAFLALRQIAMQSGVATESLADHDVISPEDEQALLHEHILVYRLDGALFFGAARRFIAVIAQGSQARVVIFRMSRLGILDASGAKALAEIVETLENEGRVVLLKGIQPGHRTALISVGLLSRLNRQGRVFQSMPVAITYARSWIQESDVLSIRPASAD
ncbi:MAG TPA: SulP family inorganic anion transporter [Thermomicrobiales bacterium]|nr:SulP family inorganic anion transporter [Thermomicrobiales bacterium]